MTMAGEDRLSGLPNKLLRRVLHFTPAKEAASTRALSRRWLSPLFSSSGAVNLETNVDYAPMFDTAWGQELKDLEAVFFSRRDAFVSAAEAALDAAADDITRLSLRVEFKFCRSWVHKFLSCASDGSQDRGVIARLLSHQAARCVEEVRVAGECWYDLLEVSDDQEEEITERFTGVYTLSLGCLPSETIRVLDLVCCNGILPAATGAVFPRLSCLRLGRSTVHLNALQSLIDAAPALATVHLESVLIVPTDHAISPATRAAPVLRCPTATVLVLERCKWRCRQIEKASSPCNWGTEKDNWGTEKDLSHHGDEVHKTPTVIDIALEIHAPRLRRFTYKGLLRQFSLSPPPLDLAKADLHFYPAPDEIRSRYSCGNYRSDEDHYRKLVTFWGFIHNISSCKELRLRVYNLEDIAVLTEARRAELLPVFANLEWLELQGVHRPKGKTAAVAIANMLRCSPVLRHVRINLTTPRHGIPRKSAYDHDYVYEREVGYYEENKFQSDRDKSLELINRCRAEPRTISLEGGVGDAAVSEIPGLSRRSFECLQTSLKTVGLKFQSEDSNCLGVKLIKFFAENGTVLEEIHMDGGNEKLCKHLNHEIETWISNSIGRKMSGASSIVVLPLKRGLF